METRVLYRLIEKIIIPKYPWIKEFFWNTGYHENLQYWGLDIYVDPETYSKLTGEVERNLKSDVSSLFKSLGPPPNNQFDTVTIYERD